MGVGWPRPLLGGGQGSLLVRKLKERDRKEKKMVSLKLSGGRTARNTAAAGSQASMGPISEPFRGQAVRTCGHGYTRSSQTFRLKGFPSSPSWPRRGL